MKFAPELPEPDEGKEHIYDIALFALIAISLMSLSWYALGINELIVSESQILATIRNEGSHARQAAFASLSRAPANEDEAAFHECFPRALGHMEHACIAADFNRDSKIDEADQYLLISARDFDLNEDGVVDLDTTFAGNNSDYSELRSCELSGIEASGCTRADLNSDGEVDVRDRALFFSARVFDLNSDGYIR